jgi:anti-anti-sigma regulatory factor
LVIIRVTGSGNMALAQPLQELLDRELNDGVRHFVFELSGCRSLDSTFMGCMVGIAGNLAKRVDELQEELAEAEAEAEAEATAQAEAESSDLDESVELSPEEAAALLQQFFTKEAKAEPPPPFVLSVNPSQGCREALTILGVDRFVPILENVQIPDGDFTDLPDRALEPTERSRLILEAHQNLVKIDIRNQERFGAFLQSLSLELARQEEAQENEPEQPAS